MPGDLDGPATDSRASMAVLVLPAAALLAGLAGLGYAGDGAAAWAFGALALLSTAVLALCAGYQYARGRHREALREARATAHAFAQLVDSWQWQTDREHRLIRLQPPHGAPASSWVENSWGGQALWERFDDGSGELRQRMQAQAPLADLRTARLGMAGASGWTLRGQPRFDGQGRFAGYLGLARATDTDDARRLDQQCLQSLWQGAPLALALVEHGDDGTWQLVRANPSGLRALALPADAALPRPWPVALAGAHAALRDVLAQPEHALRTEVGGWLLALQPVDAPRPTRLVALAQRGADEDLQALAAEHAAFSYTVSHDLRAPIRVVEGFARILKEDYGRALDRIGNDHVDRVLAAAARMNHMIDALLSLSRLSTQPLARQPVNLSQMAGFVVDDLKRAAPERQVRVTIEPGLTAHGDPTLLRMALENLLGNAWKYTGKCNAPAIRFERSQHQGREVFAVCDNGAGFDMRFADRLFGVFQRLHGGNDFPGSGVGLASVRRIVRRHGGDIWAEAEVGQGARFYFTLAGS